MPFWGIDCGLHHQLSSHQSLSTTRSPSPAISKRIGLRLTHEFVARSPKTMASRIGWAASSLGGASIVRCPARASSSPCEKIAVPEAEAHGRRTPTCRPSPLSRYDVRDWRFADLLVAPVQGRLALRAAGSRVALSRSTTVAERSPRRTHLPAPHPRRGGDQRSPLARRLLPTPRPGENVRYPGRGRGLLAGAGLSTAAAASRTLTARSGFGRVREQRSVGRWRLGEDDGGARRSGLDRLWLASTPGRRGSPPAGDSQGEGTRLPDRHLDSYGASTAPANPTPGRRRSSTFSSTRPAPWCAP
jgi:hypothetical protein